MRLLSLYVPNNDSMNCARDTGKFKVIGMLSYSMSVFHSPNLFQQGVSCYQIKNIASSWCLLPEKNYNNCDLPWPYSEVHTRKDTHFTCLILGHVSSSNFNPFPRILREPLWRVEQGAFVNWNMFARVWIKRLFLDFTVCWYIGNCYKFHEDHSYEQW